MVNCKNDGAEQGSFEILDELQIAEEHPEMLTAFQDFRDNYLKIFPNPSNRNPEITLESSNFHGSIKSIIALDQIGAETALEFSLKENLREISQYQVKLENLKRGVFSLLIVYEDAHTATTKLIH